MTSRTLLISLFSAVSAAAAVPAQSQEFRASSTAGMVLSLADGRQAVLVPRAGGVVVDGLVEGERPGGTPAVDLRVGDLVVRFQRLRGPTVAQIQRGWDSIAVGGEVSLELRRADAIVEVRFTKPRAVHGERRMAMRMAGEAGPVGAAGAWTAVESPGGAAEVVIAGAHLRENSQGMPEVMFLGSHPAAPTVALRTGDVVVGVGGGPVSALAGLAISYQRIAVGAEVVLIVQRGARRETLRFPKPAP